MKGSLHTTCSRSSLRYFVPVLFILVLGVCGCCPGGEICANDSCCHGACVGGACCAAGKECGNTCCGEKRQCVAGRCCTAEKTCGNSCCGWNEQCIDGQCTAAESCGNATCGEGSQCVGGECCSASNVCGESCCDGNDACVDGKCCDPVSGCDTPPAWYKLDIKTKGDCSCKPDPYGSFDSISVCELAKANNPTCWVCVDQLKCGDSCCGNLEHCDSATKKCAKCPQDLTDPTKTVGCYDTCCGVGEKCTLENGVGTCTSCGGNVGCGSECCGGFRKENCNTVLMRCGPCKNSFQECGGACCNGDAPPDEDDLAPGPQKCITYSLNSAGYPSDQRCEEAPTGCGLNCDPGNLCCFGVCRMKRSSGDSCCGVQGKATICSGIEQCCQNQCVPKSGACCQAPNKNNGPAICLSHRDCCISGGKTLGCLDCSWYDQFGGEQMGCKVQADESFTCEPIGEIG